MSHVPGETYHTLAARCIPVVKIANGTLGRQKRPPPGARARAPRVKVSNAGGGARTRAPPVGDFQTWKESERMGKGKGK